MISKSKISSVEAYLTEGCGRCSHYATPQCKVHLWTKELIEFRRIVLSCGLTEEIKWSMPCYTHKGKNILIISAFKNYASINFFKGALIQDPQGILAKAGENSQSARLLKMTNYTEIIRQEDHIRAYIFDAILVEEAGLKVETKPISDQNIPESLQNLIDNNPEVATAYAALTPGRKRSHIIYISGAKQTATQERRAIQCIEKILKGQGWLERPARS
jgi:uncharacterized protein YdeI (YjbR/CyaY-like superfamily)